MGNPSLPNGSYERKVGEWGLLNPGPSELDAKIRESCRLFRSLSQAERVKFTSTISLDEFYTLMSFSRRAAVFALRDKDAKLLQDGLDALAMIETKRTDFRDILMALALLYHTAFRIGLDPDVMFHDAAGIAEPELANLMTSFAARDTSSKTLKAFGYVEVETQFGAGFAQWGFKRYSPESDLLAVSQRIALMVDSDSYQTDCIELATDLPETWLNGPDSGQLPQMLAKVSAGATISAQLQSDKHAQAGSQQFTIFVVEVDSRDSAETLFQLSRSKKPKDYCMLGTVAGRLFCLVIARSFVQGVASFESGESLNRFQKPLQEALGQAKN